MSDLHQAGDDDGDEGDDLGVGEEVLHPGAPLHVGAVHEGQQTCEGSSQPVSQRGESVETCGL